MPKKDDTRAMAKDRVRQAQEKLWHALDLIASARARLSVLVYDEKQAHPDLGPLADNLKAEIRNLEICERDGTADMDGSIATRG